MTEISRKRLLTACYAFLLPVAKALLRNGLSFREFEELGRLAFTHVASRDFGVRGRSTNTSRISVMTGIPRKEVTRIRSLESEYDADSIVDLSVLGDILHLWATNPKYCDLAGFPRRLPMEGEISFEALVTQSSADLPVGAVRSELLRCRAIEVGDKGYVRLVRRYVVSDEFDEKLSLGLSVSLKALAETVTFNSDSTRTKPGRIERFVRSEPLSAAARLELRRQIRERISTYTEGFDDLFGQFESTPDSTYRAIGVGIYYWEEED